MATSKEEGSVFDCPICLEKLSNPKYLPCLHTFCELCIQSFIDSSISDCIVNGRNISFDCPVCRRVNQAPTQNISAKEWAEQLPKNHQLLAIKDSYEKGNNTESKVFCDSCTQNNEQVIATLSCKSCRVILCETCCKRIHKKVRSYAVHTIVDLRSANKEVDNTDELWNCVVHTNRAIEVYCYDHEKLGCCFCLTTEHKECKTVLSLDEIADNLENPSKSFIRETKKIRDITTSAVLATKKNITELTQQKNEILQNIDQRIKEIKIRLDNLHIDTERSLRRAHEGQISELTSVLTILNDFDATLAQSENVTSTIMQNGSRKQMFIAMEKIKMQISDQMKNMRTRREHMKKSTLKWYFNEAMDSVNKLSKLGDFRYMDEKVDFVAPFEKHYNIIKEEVDPNKIVSIAQLIKEIKPCKTLRVNTINSTCRKIMPTAFDCVHLSWCSSFWDKHEQQKFVKFPSDLEDDRVFILLNPDKSFRAFGSEAEREYMDLRWEGHTDSYFFEEIESLFDSEQAFDHQTRLKDVTGKEIDGTIVFEAAFDFLVQNFFANLQNRCNLPIEPFVNFVLVVPTHSNEKIKQFAHRAAVKSGIPYKSLTSVLETEAIFRYHQHSGDMKFSVGKKHIIVSFGDTKTTLSVNIKPDIESPDEVLKITTGPWGFESVIIKFESFIMKLIGDEKFTIFKLNYWEHYQDFIRSFRNKISSSKTWKNEEEEITLSLPTKIIEWMRDGSKNSIEDIISLFRYTKTFKILSGIKARWHFEDFRKFGDKVTNRVIEQIDAALVGDMADVETILLVGSLSYLVENHVRKCFITKDVVVLDYSAVLTGAVYDI